jgi:hypothetical protein
MHLPLGRKFTTHDLVSLGAKAMTHQLSPIGRKSVSAVAGALKVPSPPTSELEK